MTGYPEGRPKGSDGPHRAAGMGRGRQTVRHAVADDPGAQRERTVGNW